jgi:hypothetical protein
VDYQKYYDQDSEFKLDSSATEHDFRRAADEAIVNFGKNKLMRAVDSKDFTLAQYHQLLIKIFHQVYYSSSTFSLAASRCHFLQKNMRDYLITHAEEERFHWTWILADLESSGYKGQDPRRTMPALSAAGYFGYAHFLAFTDPGARLAMAYVLEGISATYGVSTGKKAINLLGLKPDQATFFIGHGELDVGHSEEVLDCLLQAQPDQRQWGFFVDVATTTSGLYKRMYDEVIEN